MVKRRVKPGRICASGVAVAAQQAHAKRVEGGEVGRRIQARFLQQRGYAFAHLVGRLVGEGHGQDGRGRHATRGYDVRDAMRDDASLTAAGPRQNEQRAFGMRDGFALLGV